MESSDSIDKSWDTKSDLTTTTAQRSDPLAKLEAPEWGGWKVNVKGREIVDMTQADVMSKFRNGELSGATLVWREGMDSWAKLEAVPTFQLAPPGADDNEDSSRTETNIVAVYERPMATLVFDEAVEDEWKAPPKPRESPASARPAEPSKTARSVSARPVAPSFPSLAPGRSPVVPADEPPPPPPLPPRRSNAPEHGLRRAQPTIPGGLAAPTPPPATVPPAKRSTPLPSAPPVSALRPSASPVRPSASPAGAGAATSSARPTKSPAPPATTTLAPSPLLAAIAAAASNPEPALDAASDVPAPALAATSLSPLTIADEPSFGAAFRTTKSVPLRSAAIACAGSALLASLLTGLVVGSSSPKVAAPAAEPPARTVAAAPVPPPPAPAVAPSPPPSPEPVTEAKSEPAPSADKVALTELAAEKPKPKKVVAWKPPKPAAAPGEDGAEPAKPAPNPERDDPMRAVPDRAAEGSSTQQTDWQENPGF